MGLDMYLTKRTYVKNWKHTARKERTKVTVLRGGTPCEDIDPKKISYIVEDIHSWRKANAIHAWFVANVQDGEDDCDEYEVSEEKLKLLLDTVTQVLDSSKLVAGKVIESYTFKGTERVNNMVEGKVMEDSTLAEALLPTESGFFFGGTEYDEYYYADLVETKKVLTKLLNNPKLRTGRDNYLRSDIYYQSSW